MEDDKPLTEEQECAVDALLTNFPMSAALKVAHVSAQDIHDWLSLPLFCATLAAAHVAILEDDWASYERLLPRVVAALIEQDQALTLRETPPLAQ